MARPKFFPTNPEQFLAELERRAPEPRFGPDMTEQQMRHDAGRRSLVLEMRDFLAFTQKVTDPDVRS
jgi:hypothetical protein